jgi:hypothetical protein
VRYTTTGTIVDANDELVTVKLTPKPTNRWYFAISYLSALEREQDQVALRRYLYGKFRHSLLSDWFDDLLENLAADALALMELTHNEEPGKFDALFEALPSAIAEHLRQLNPATSNLRCLSAEMIFIHGAKDRITPTQESPMFATKVERSRLYVLEDFEQTKFESTEALVQLFPMLEYLLERRHTLDDSVPVGTCA